MVLKHLDVKQKHYQCRIISEQTETKLKNDKMSKPNQIIIVMQTNK